MRFIVLFAFFAVAANAAVAEQNGKDRFLLGVIGAILDHMYPATVIPGPVNVVESQPIAVNPVVVDSYEPISVGPAIIDSYEPISVGPAIVDAVSDAPQTVLPVLSAPLVQIILNVNQAVSEGVVAIEGLPVVGPSPVLVQPEIVPTPVTVVESAFEPTPVVVVEGPAIEPTPVAVEEGAGIVLTPVVVAQPIIPTPVVTLPDSLN